VKEPYEKISLQTGQASYKVTDEQVNDLIKTTGSDKAAFEIIITAAVSAELYRWTNANKLLMAVLKME